MKRWTIVTFALILGASSGIVLTERVLHGQAPLAVPAERTTYRDVVKRVLPAVVSIESKVKPASMKKAQPNERRRARPDVPGLPEEFRRFFEDMDSSPFEGQGAPPSAGFGSGFIVDAKGIVLTNFHVVEGASQVEVELRDGRKFTSKSIQGDRKTDLAIIRLENVGGSLPYLEMGDSDGMEIGDRVLAVGAPFGLTGTVTSGIISAKGRNMRMNMYEDFLQTDAAINPGNSGGPLVNLEGKVIGINSAIKSRTGGFQGVGLAIASNLAKNVMVQLQKDGIVHRGYLGVQIRDLNPEVASRLGIQEQSGVLVSSTLASAPAAKGGVLSGDVITAINGKPVKDGRELQQIVAGLPLGKPVEVNLVRDGKAKAVSVTIEEQPEDLDTARAPVPQAPRRDKEAIALDKIGLELSNLTEDNAEQFGFKDRTSGAVIANVYPGSFAASAGLRRGMVLAKIDKKAVNSAQEAKQALDMASLENGVLLQVVSSTGGVNYVVLKVEGDSKQ